MGGHLINRLAFPEQRELARPLQKPACTHLNQAKKWGVKNLNPLAETKGLSSTGSKEPRLPDLKLFFFV
jgi:hypothetical protein